MKKLLLFALTFATLFLSSCSLISFLMEDMCQFSSDSDHCYQTAAIQDSDTENCEKIGGADFAAGGSNPPRDKCYMQIAENSEDYGPCDKMEGGMMSYTKEECIMKVAIKKNDKEGCDSLKGTSYAQQCYNGLIAQEDEDKPNPADTDTKIADLIEKLKSDPNNAELQAELKKLKGDKAAAFTAMSAEDQAAYMKSQREAIMDGIEDEDVKVAIAADFNSYRNSGSETDINKLMDKLKDITEQKKTLKEIDDHANEMIDSLKGNITEYVDGKVEDAKGQAIDAIAGKGKEWIEQNGGEKLKEGLANLESLKERYDKGSEMYNKANEQYEKMKKIYDEVKGVYDKIDDVNKLKAEGKIDEGKASVLRGAILLSVGLEKATGYIPIFGSTVSTITADTFKTVIELAKKRAQRTEAINKCIDDPENCDPNGISAY